MEYVHINKHFEPDNGFVVKQIAKDMGLRVPVIRGALTQLLSAGYVRKLGEFKHIVTDKGREALIQVEKNYVTQIQP